MKLSAICLLLPLAVLGGPTECTCDHDCIPDYLLNMLLGRRVLAEGNINDSHRELLHAVCCDSSECECSGIGADFECPDHQRCFCRAASRRVLLFTNPDDQECMCKYDTDFDGYALVKALVATQPSSTGAPTTAPTTAAPTAAPTSACNGYSLTAIISSECPEAGDCNACSGLPNCKDLSLDDGGDLCEADGECGTDIWLDNCGIYDMYRKTSTQ
uniref:Uncharacterized protein n=1 Tax=Fibrocapsa japonica TaxID=94617 RepID=A0A7S2USA4_9STRA|mmetsp:Transcript_10741/g.15931  ORF Transcript_10741/g.15931 Transcript_10741/m.15931 type:complete len:215 (+) Transcript_10741:83-727(+)